MIHSIAVKRLAICFGSIFYLLAIQWRPAFCQTNLGPQPEQQGARGNETNSISGPSTERPLKCSKHSILLARQTLAHELDQMNSLGLPIWFQDLDKNELIESQKQSLGSIIMSNANSPLLSDLDGRLLLELDASYFRFPSADKLGTMLGASGRSLAMNATTTTKGDHHHGPFMRLGRRRPESCHIDANRSEFVFEFGLMVGPIEHHLDVTYNLPRDVRLTQPTEWRYAQISILVPKMSYEVVLRQRITDKPQLASGCPLMLADISYQPAAHHRSPLIQSWGLAAGNQSQWQLDRLFSDYTRPAISDRIRQAIKFQLGTKTLPLESERMKR